MALACLGVLVTGYLLEPSARGVGTHTQLGLAACGFENMTGLPCMTCGMTTATTLATHGRWWESIVTQPAGFAFACLMGVGVWVGGWSAWSGMSLGLLARQLLNVWVLIAAGAVVAGAWVYKLAGAMAAAGA